MRRHVPAAALTIMAVLVAALIGVAQRPQRAHAQDAQGARASLIFFTVEDVARGRARAVDDCANPSMIGTTMPNRDRPAIPGVVLLCERR
jgi:hypothetical protein